MPEETKPKSPRFARWIDATGAHVIAEALDVDKTTVWAWRRYALGLKNPRRPNPSKLLAILKFANGRLVPKDIYPPAVEAEK